MSALIHGSLTPLHSSQRFPSLPVSPEQQEHETAAEVEGVLAENTSCTRALYSAICMFVDREYIPVQVSFPPCTFKLEIFIMRIKECGPK